MEVSSKTDSPKAENFSVPSNTTGFRQNPVDLSNKGPSSQPITNIGNVLLKLFFHSLAMFSLPFLTYFGIKSYAENELDIQSPRSYIYGVIGAVIIVQVIIGSYIYHAMKEESMNRNANKKVS